MAQASHAASRRVVGALQDLVGRYLDALALGGDPIASVDIRLVGKTYAYGPSSTDGGQGKEFPSGPAL